MSPRIRYSVVVAILIAAFGVGAFLAGRGSVDTSATGTRLSRVMTADAADAYRSGREAAFGGFDGGWSFGEPYIVTLRRGEPGITYRFARRRPMRPGVEYRVCGRAVCAKPAP